MRRGREWIEKLKNSQFFISTFKVGSGQLIAQGLSLISVPILSRIYSGTAYGDTALIVSTAVILINVSTFGLNSAIMRPTDEEEAKTVFTTAFLANFLICTVFTAICALLCSNIKLFVVSDSYGLALLFMWMYSILYTTSSLLAVYANRKGEYNKLFLNPIIGAVANFVVAIPLGVMGLGYKGLMLTSVVQYLLVCIHMLHHNSPFQKNYKFSDLKRVFVNYKEYVLYQYPSNFIGNFGIEYPAQFFGRTFSSQEFGGYSMCIRLLQFPIRLIAAPVSTVYFKTATEYHRAGKNLAAFTYKMISRILLISAVPVVIFIFVSEPLFSFVLGESWSAAGRLASFLIIQYVLLFCSQTTSYALVSIGRQRMGLVVTIVRLAVGVVSCTVGYLLFGTMTATVFCYSLAQCLYGIYNLSVIFYCMDRKYLKKFLLSSLLYTASMFIAVLLRSLFIK